MVGEPALDGVYSEVSIIPPANVVFGGAFDPTHAAWFQPVADTVTFHLPEDAEPGTYKVVVKAHRDYLGQLLPRTAVIEIQVGTNTHTEPQLTTGPCNTCHSGGGDLGLVLHANDDRAACLSCHTSYPDDHVATYGPITSMYVGGGVDSFQQCTDSCHVEHPDSGFGEDARWDRGAPGRHP